MPRAVTKVNGEDPMTMIARLNLKFSGYQDPDSQWNSGFESYALPDALSFLSGTLVQQFPSITLDYDDGTSETKDNFAIVRAGANFTGVSTGEDFYARFCNPDAALAAMSASMTEQAPEPTSTEAVAPPAPTIENFPMPVIRDDGANITAGYFLDGPGYEDVAVLSVLGFSPAGDFDGTRYLTNFQSTVEKFLAMSKQAGKTRLVVDVTANGGGFVVAGYELFTQIFPDANLFQAHDLRLSDSLQDMARLTSGFSDETIAEASNGTDALKQQAVAILANSEVVSNLLPGGVFTPAGNNLSTVDEILSPVTLQGDRFTAYQQTPLNETSASFNLTGTGTRSNPPPAVFAPENVVLLTDGTCGSTCTLFSYLMIMQRDVKTVAVGGRPQLGPMQSIAGVEGAQVFPLNSLSNAAAAVLTLSDPVRRGELNGSELAVLAEGYALARAATPDNAGAVNGKNAFSPEDAQTPLQFTYMPANCRFFYTADMIYGPANVWRRAVDATWTDPARFCVEGSRMTVNKTSRLDPFFQRSLSIDSNGAAAARRWSGSGAAAVVVAVVLGLVALL